MFYLIQPSVHQEIEKCRTNHVTSKFWKNEQEINIFLVLFLSTDLVKIVLIRSWHHHLVVNPEFNIVLTGNYFNMNQNPESFDFNTGQIVEICGTHISW